MFLRNWYNHLFHSLIGFNAGINVIDMTGVSRTAGYSHMKSSSYNYFSFGTKTGHEPSMYYLRTRYYGGESGVLLGTGTTPPTLDDYKLSGDLITNYDYTASVSASLGDDGVTITALYTVTNSGSDAFTVGEIGLFNGATNTSSGATDGSYVCLIERTLLDEPVTIPSGGVGQITYSITFPFPT